MKFAVAYRNFDLEMSLHFVDGDAALDAAQQFLVKMAKDSAWPDETKDEWVSWARSFDSLEDLRAGLYEANQDIVVGEIS